MLIGHLAVSSLEHRYTKVAFAPVMAAALFPDAVDKVAHYVLAITQSGRLWGHTLVGAVLTTLVCLLLFGRRNALSWLIGYLSHLVCDIGSVVPWLYPFVTYDFPPPEDFATTLWMGLTQPRLLLEIALAVWACVVFRSEMSGAMRKLRAKLTTARVRARSRPLAPPTESTSPEAPDRAQR